MKIREIRIVESRGNWDTMLVEDKVDQIATNQGAKLVKAYLADKPKPGETIPTDPDGIKNFAKQLLNQIKEADSDPQGKNLQFLANFYIQGQFKLEDIPQLKIDLNILKNTQAVLQTKLKDPANAEIAKKYPNGTKDLLYIKTKADLDELVKLVKAESGGPDRAAWEDVVKESKKIIWTPDFKVFIPETENASKAIRRTFPDDIKWCTTFLDSHNQHNYYSNQGPLYVIMMNTGKPMPRMWQLHYESAQFKDERDLEITQPDIALLSKSPEYTDFLNCLIVKHYGKFLPPEETKGKCKYPV